MGIRYVIFILFYLSTVLEKLAKFFRGTFLARPVYTFIYKSYIFSVYPPLFTFSVGYSE